MHVCVFRVCVYDLFSGRTVGAPESAADEADVTAEDLEELIAFLRAPVANSAP